MAKKWDRSTFDEERRRAEEREKRIGFLFPPKNKGEEINVEILDDTFTQIFEGEAGLDDREVKWTQPQILVKDLKDNRRKAFKLNSGLATQMWEIVEKGGGDPLNMRGSIFTIIKEGDYIYNVTYRKPAPSPDIIDEKEVEEKIREVVKNLNASGNKSPEDIRLWVNEYLRVEGIKAPETLVDSIFNRIIKENNE